MPQNVLGVINANVTFTDALGATYTVYTTTGRFRNWVPDYEEIGPEAVSLGTGAISKWIERVDGTAAFDMDHLPAQSLHKMQSIKQWLDRGGSVTVNTSDIFGHSYTCTRKPKGKCTITGPDKMLEYTLHLELRNSANDVMDCIYTRIVGAGYTLAITPNPLLLQAGVGPTQLTATMTDPDGNVVTGLPVMWYVDNQAVLRVGPTGIITPLAVGQATVYATSGGLVATDRATVTAAIVQPATITLSPTSLPFTGTTYAVGTPQINITGVAPIVVTATIKNASGVVIPYSAGALTWSISNGQFFILDNMDGTCTVWAVFASGSAVLTCTSTVVGTVHQTAAATSVAGVLAALIPDVPAVNFTAVGQQQSVTVTGINQYGTAGY